MSHFYRGLTPVLLPLQIGIHDYNGTKIEVVPIRTMGYGLCHKFKMSKPFPTFGKLQIVIGSSSLETDRLHKVDLFIAAENTWQGLFYHDWPYSKIPLTASGVFSTKVAKIITIDLEENVWNYRDGEDNFGDCMNGLQRSKCASIFDPRSLKNL